MREYTELITILIFVAILIIVAATGITVYEVSESNIRSQCISQCETNIECIKVCKSY
jgi:hypothetical protein